MTGFEIADLKITQREGGYSRGQEGFELILQAALSVLIDEGYKALTLRRIASECGMKIGHVTYYFKSKDDLIRALLDAVVGSYTDAIEAAIAEAPDDPEQQLINLVTLLLEDITTKKTTFIFPELWSLANHDEFVKELVEQLYELERLVFEEIVQKLNPTLSSGDRKLVSTFIVGSIEGMTIFAGYGKPMRRSMGKLRSIATRSFIDYIQNVRPGQIASSR